MKVEELLKIRAKSDGTSLYDHTNMVIKVGMELFLSLPLSKEQKFYLKEKFIIAAAIHDLGKIHPYFQSMLNGDLNHIIRHELISLWFCYMFLDIDTSIMFAIATHHKNIYGSQSTKQISLVELSETKYEILLRESKNRMNIETLRSWLSLFSIKVSFKKNINQNSYKKILNILQINYQSEILSLKEKKEYSMLRALLQASDHIASAGIKKIPHYQNIELDNFRPRKDGIIYPFRHFQKCLQSWSGDVVLYAPTGSGKTEAALSWVFANQKDNNRLFYLLPYTASINAMVRRLKKVYKENIVIVQHSKALNFVYNEILNETSNFNRNYQEIEAKAKNKNSLAHEVYYPIKVTTLHQILRIPFYGKGWELSLLDCQNALFIIDEFHAYNALLTGMMLGVINLFRKIYHANFFLMSATIPHFLLKEIIDKDYDGDWSKLLKPDKVYESDALIMGKKRHILICHQNEYIKDSICQIESLLNEGLSVLVIVNNVNTCQILYEYIYIEESKKMMLHGGFNLRSRKVIEEAITNDDKSKRPQLLVATQAVEVSLDIDYNVAFIENAPIDSLIQRFGRVNRSGNLQDKKGNKKLAEIHVFENIQGKTPFYDKVILNDTWNNLLKLNGKNLSEDDLVTTCNNVYKDGYSKKQKQDFEQGFMAVCNFEKNWITGNCEDWIENIMDNSNQKIDVLCYNLKSEYSDLISQQRFIEANELLVSVYPYHPVQRSTDFDVLIAEDLFYDAQKGCVEIIPDKYEII